MIEHQTKRIPEALRNFLDMHGITGRFAEVDGIMTYAVEKGSKRSLVLVHGFASYSYTWRYTIGPLSKYFRVIAIDLPGFGLSERPQGFSYTLTGYVAFMKRLFETFNLDSVHLVGHSLGGTICLEFCRMYSQFVEAMVLAATPIAGKANFSKKSLSNLLLYSYYDKSFITDDLIQIFHWTNPSHAQGPPDVREILSVKRHGAEQPRLSIPCLIIWGKEDWILPCETAFDLQEQFRHAEYKVISRCGHAPQEERYDEFNALVLQHFWGDCAHW